MWKLFRGDKKKHDSVPASPKYGKKASEANLNDDIIKGADSPNDFPSSYVPSPTFSNGGDRLISGWLQKHSKKQVKKKMFVAIKPEQICYFKSEQDRDPYKSFSLKCASVERVETCGFKIVYVAKCTTFFCEDESTALTWMNSIKSANTIPKSPSFCISRTASQNSLPRYRPSLSKNTAGMTIEDEYNIAVSAVALFMKPLEARSTEEQAYVIAMAEYLNVMSEFRSHFQCMPEHSLATGTSIFLCPVESRTKTETEYVNFICIAYLAEIDKLSEAMGLTHEEQLEIVKGAVEIFTKEPEKLTVEEKEYLFQIEEYMRDIMKFENLCGLKAKHTFVSETTVFAKFTEEQTSENNMYMEEAKKL